MDTRLFLEQAIDELEETREENKGLRDFKPNIRKDRLSFIRSLNK